MREVFADFANMSARPELDLGNCIPLGREDIKPALDGLRDGEPVLLVEWGELQAPGIARLIERDGIRHWYGLVNREDIRDVETANDLS